MMVSPEGREYLRLAAHLSAAAQCAVLLPDYRLAPEAPFPAALEDCVQACQWLTANGPAGPARADGVALTLEVWEGMFHVFQSHDPLLPEGREAIAHIATAMRTAL